MRSRVILAVVCGLVVGCFVGDERDKEPPAGYPGGPCASPEPPSQPEPWCVRGSCNVEHNYCYNQEDACEGFFCGGEERGRCLTDPQGQPTCQCNDGFVNDMTATTCCPIGGFDLDCMTPVEGSTDAGSR